MATEADVLRSITAIMEGGLRREEAKVQSALAMMQFAQQKRMQDIALTQSNLELVSKSVQQQKPQVASEFLSSSGLAGIYQQGEEGEPAMDTIEDMAKSIRSKQFFGRKFDANKAQSIAAAVWNYYSAEDPNSILKLAEDLQLTLILHLDLLHYNNSIQQLPLIQLDLDQIFYQKTVYF